MRSNIAHVYSRWPWVMAPSTSYRFLSHSLSLSFHISSLWTILLLFYGFSILLSFGGYSSVSLNAVMPQIIKISIAANAHRVHTCPIRRRQRAPKVKKCSSAEWWMVDACACVRACGGVRALDAMGRRRIKGKREIKALHLFYVQTTDSLADLYIKCTQWFHKMYIFEWPDVSWSAKRRKHTANKTKE